MHERTCPTVHVRSSADPGALLIHHGDPRRGWRSIVIHGPTIRIGAAPTADLVLDGAAPHHCTIHRRGARFVLHDHGSRLGTYVDSRRRREPFWLDDAARLGVGRHTLIVVPLPPAAATPPRPLLAPSPALEAHAPPRHESSSLAPLRPRLPSPWHPRLLAAVLAGALGGALLGHRLTAALAAPGAASSPALPLSAAAAAPPSDPTRIAPRSLDPSAAVALASTQTIAARPQSSRFSPAPPSDHETGPATRAPAPTSPPPARILRVDAGDTWEHLAHRHALSSAQLRAANPTLRRELRAGDRLHLPLPRPLTDPPRACPAHLAVPAGALAVGSVDDGRLEGAVRLPELPLYTLRCPAHAHATSATASALIGAIACFRERAGHRGEVVVGDLSREQGGPLGHHLSHQTGRDVDLWLPTLRHDYLRGCPHCGTDLCRPDPADVDWLATWQLIDALEATGQVTDVFLDRALHRDLADAAIAAGVPAARVADRLGWARSGRPLVRHADAHRHHLHVRFRCDAGERTCEARPRRLRAPPLTLEADALAARALGRR